VQSLFRTALPPQPRAVRIVFWRYFFTNRETRRKTGAWWNREEIARSREITCRN
jgi:hypothetical protein